MDTNDKVLMALMRLDIGGAETHALELCKALKQRGVDVYVASNGGAYAAELEQAGIHHIRVPLHNKNPLNMVKSYRLIRKIIVDNDIRLVHAHARIPAFLCGLLWKRLHFRFVTTVHGVFTTAFPYRVLTNWGERTFAVSDDLKRYLMKHYHLPERNIVMTINGVDTDKFSPATDTAGLRGELGLAEDSRVILNVSRMDTDMTVPTHALIAISETLDTAYGNIEIVVVGQGDDWERVKKSAAAVNQRLGKTMIHVTGGRTDVNRFYAMAELFVGVSRSALEAMSAGLPVVLAGNQGYIGIFDESTRQGGIDTNFCCRGFDTLSTERLLQDLTTLLDAPAQTREKLGDFGRETVLARYSVTRMADDVLTLYATLRTPAPVRAAARSNDFLMCGYYGTKNHGDDTLLQAITNDLRQLVPGAGITVISNRPRETRAQYAVNAVHRFRLLKIYRLLRETNLLIFGGGTLVQDLTSSQSLFYYLTVIRLALRGGAKVMLYANGIGPVRKPMNRRMTKKTLNRVDLITLRDDASAHTLRELGVTKPRILLTADAAFSIRVSDKEAGGPLLDELGLSDKKYFCVAVRSWKYSKPGFERDITAFCDSIAERYGYEALFIPMQRSFDLEISRRIIGGMRHPAHLLAREFSIDELLNVIRGAEFLTGMRLHTLVYAAKMGTPIIGLVYDPKVRGLLDTFAQPFHVDVDDFSVQTLEDFADKVVRNRAGISAALLSTAAELESKARMNADYAFELFKKS